MEEIHISAAKVIELGIYAVFLIAGPFVSWIVWRRVTRAAWMPLIAGLIGYLFIGLLRGMARVLLLSGMQDSPWLYYVLQAVFAGVFEEGGRYIIFRWCIPNRDLYRDAVSYGIGHGGMEDLLIDAGSAALYAFGVALFLRTGGMAAFAPGGAGYFLMEGLDEAGTREIVQSVADTSLPHTLFRLFDSIPVFQCCMSVLVFTAVHYDISPKWFLAAIGLHTLVDIIPALHLAGDFSKVETDVLYTLFQIGVLYLTYRVWKHYRPAPAEELTEPDL